MKTTEKLKESALSIFQAGLEAADPFAAVAKHLKRDGNTIIFTDGNGHTTTFSLGMDKGEIRRVIVVGAGKASARMCQAAEEALGEHIEQGLVIVKDDHSVPTQHVRIEEASHPVPDERGFAASQQLLELVTKAGESTLILVLISGGGSALLPLPAEGITLKEKQQVTDLLLGAGADIKEINAVRKHMSAIKGGRLARAASPAQVVTLILSDVVGDQLDSIASGPTVPDSSTFADATDVLKQRSLLDRVPASVARHFELGCAGKVPETPKTEEKFFKNTKNILIGTNSLSLKACAEASRKAGWNTLVLSSTIEGETRDIARMHAAIAQEVRRSGQPIESPACIISGGETTVTIKGNGKGGRNQEFALAAALDIKEMEGMAILSAGTDGTDGPTDAAGAIVFGDTHFRAENAGLSVRNSLENNDAYPFFDRLGDLIRTGPTHTNVMDIHVILVDSL